MIALMQPSLGRLKRLIAVMGVGLAWAAPLVLVALATMTMLSATTGADTRDAFTEAPAVPAEVGELVEWRPDAVGLLRSVEPETRDAAATAWLGALAAADPGAEAVEVDTWYSGPELERARERADLPSLADGPTWTGHHLHVHFYSLDGRILGLEVESHGVLSVDSTMASVDDRFDVVLVLEDGNWRVHAATARSRS